MGEVLKIGLSVDAGDMARASAALDELAAAADRADAACKALGLQLLAPAVWNYDFRSAPRAGLVDIIVIRAEQDCPYRSREALTVCWDNGTSCMSGEGPVHEENIGWTTGGCGRYPDEDFECWLPMPERRSS